MGKKIIKGYILRISVVLSRSVSYKNVQIIQSDIINSLMKNSKILNDIHLQKRIKMYSFTSLKPIEMGGIYKMNHPYQFEMKSIHKYFLEEFKDQVENNNNDLFKVRKAEILEVDLNAMAVESIYTTSPYTITKEDKRSWIANQEEKGFLRERIIKNTNKKYNTLNDTNEVPYDFMENIIMLNKYPIPISYKNGAKLLGNKMKIYIKQDEKSQNLAKMLAFTGILEKNALGFGCCCIGEGEVI